VCIAALHALHAPPTRVPPVGCPLHSEGGGARREALHPHCLLLCRRLLDEVLEALVVCMGMLSGAGGRREDLGWEGARHKHAVPCGHRQCLCSAGQLGMLACTALLRASDAPTYWSDHSGRCFSTRYLPNCGPTGMERVRAGSTSTWQQRVAAAASRHWSFPRPGRAATLRASTACTRMQGSQALATATVLVALPSSLSPNALEALSNKLYAYD
jgi:hypothetical protein